MAYQMKVATSYSSKVHNKSRQKCRNMRCSSQTNLSMDKVLYVMHQETIMRFFGYTMYDFFNTLYDVV